MIGEVELSEARERGDSAGRAAAPRRRRREVGTSAVSRAVNEQIARLRLSSSFNEYVCECGRKACVEVISMSAREYAALRSVRTHFVLATTHRTSLRVVEVTARYQVVEDEAPPARTRNLRSASGREYDDAG